MEEEEGKGTLLARGPRGTCVKCLGGAVCFLGVPKARLRPQAYKSASMTIIDTGAAPAWGERNGVTAGSEPHSIPWGTRELLLPPLSDL